MARETATLTPGGVTVIWPKSQEMAARRADVDRLLGGTEYSGIERH